MTVAELIEWLKTQDQEAEVMVWHHRPGDYYSQGGWVEWAPMDVEPDAKGNLCWDYTDFRNNKFVKEGDSVYGCRFLNLGKEE